MSFDGRCWLRHSHSPSLLWAKEKKAIGSGSLNISPFWAFFIQRKKAHIEVKIIKKLSIKEKRQISPSGRVSDHETLVDSSEDL